MIIQIFGKKKCRNTQKAERFFKERNIPFQMINVLEKLPSKGEWDSIMKTISKEELIDSNSKIFKKKQLQFMKYDVIEEIEENLELLKTPIVRINKKAYSGYQPDIWKEILN